MTYLHRYYSEAYKCLHDLSCTGRISNEEMKMVINSFIMGMTFEDVAKQCFEAIPANQLQTQKTKSCEKSTSMKRKLEDTVVLNENTKKSKVIEEDDLSLRNMMTNRKENVLSNQIEDLNKEEKNVSVIEHKVSKPVEEC